MAHRTLSTASVAAWHIVLSGFLQDEGRPTGMVRLWDDLCRRFLTSSTRCLLREWSADTNAIAELIWRLRNFEPPRICLYAYSWGCPSAMTLARQLRRRGLAVDRMVLSDPVYRHWFAAGNWRVLFGRREIVVPSNVRHVTWYRQDLDWPRGHNLVAEEPIGTRLDDPIIANVGHGYMDDLRLFHQACFAAAEGDGDDD